MTLLAPQISGALFLNYHGTLWFVPGLEPGHWDWRFATPLPIDHPLVEAANVIAGLLRGTHARLLRLIHRW
ncbi:hypothetical protein [Micromonospora sp. NPDC051296]|uniref:hypothetical protein n=1 Tax=Micromonospora sp. NPDC051296 TaxID=3155046 RepID=UPI0034254D82